MNYDDRPLADYSHFTLEELVNEVNSIQRKQDELKEEELTLRVKLATLELAQFETERDYKHAKSALVARHIIDAGEQTENENNLSEMILVH